MTTFKPRKTSGDTISHVGTPSRSIHNVQNVLL